jgi:hypothetical protein
LTGSCRANAKRPGKLLGQPGRFHEFRSIAQRRRGTGLQARASTLQDQVDVVDFEQSIFLLAASL